MFDMTKIKTRYFNLTLPNGTVLEVEPPKMKVLRKVLSLATMDDINVQSIDELSEGLSLVLSKNKQNHKVTAKWLMDNMDIDGLVTLTTAYFNWVGEVQGSKN